ncbi:MAG: EamA family transporter [Bacteroidota bacterium]|nr:EamA family transporter [Bacteroidota bacterium]
MKASLIQLHTAVFLAGFTGILGKLISLNEGLLVWYRILLTVLILVFLLYRKKAIQKVSSRLLIRLFATGFLIALHWVCFYGSIKYANVSIGLVCLSASGLFTALAEPLLTHKPFSLSEVLLSLLSLTGIFLIFHFDVPHRTGIILGIVSAVLAALFAVLNKRYIHTAPPQTIMLYELTGGWMLLTLLMPWYVRQFPPEHLLPTLQDWGWLLLLAGFCTVWAMDLMLQALKKVSAFTQNLTLNLEPVYGIILAFILFHENKYLHSSFYAGILLIGCSVIIQMFRVMKRNSH